jgi:hypothetical protein
MRALAGLAAAIACAALTGCGDLSRDELGRGVDSLTAIAAEGRLVARDVAHDRTKSTFVRVHAGELSGEAEHEAEKLTDAHPAPGTNAHRLQAVRLAERLSSALSELQTHPGEEARGRRAGRQLVEVQDALEALGRRT